MLAGGRLRDPTEQQVQAEELDHLAKWDLEDCLRLTFEDVTHYVQQIFPAERLGKCGTGAEQRQRGGCRTDVSDLAIW